MQAPLYVVCETWLILSGHCLPHVLLQQQGPCSEQQYREWAMVQGSVCMLRTRAKHLSLKWYHDC